MDLKNLKKRKKLNLKEKNRLNSEKNKHTYNFSLLLHKYRNKITKKCDLILRLFNYTKGRLETKDFSCFVVQTNQSTNCKKVKVIILKKFSNVCISFLFDSPLIFLMRIINQN